MTSFDQSGIKNIKFRILYHICAHLFKKHPFWILMLKFLSEFKYPLILTDIFNSIQHSYRLFLFTNEEHSLNSCL